MSTSAGEGSYGSVFKALHKESGQVLAIKQVPVESDLGELIRELISVTAFILNHNNLPHEQER